MQKKKNHPPTWLEILFENFLNWLDDLIFLQNVHNPIGYKVLMRVLSILIVAAFLYLTVSAFFPNK
jgi:hypothetical protein